MIITVASLKGGVGKSTSAIHIARALEDSAPTLIADMDPNRTVTSWAKHNTSRKFGVTTEHGLARDARNYTHVVIDTPARPENLDLASLLGGTDILIIPSPPHFYSIDTLQSARDLFLQAASPAVRILLTQTPPPPQKDAKQARDILEQLGFTVLATQIRRAKAFEHAARIGGFVSDVRSDANASLAMSEYEAATAEIIQIIAELAEAAEANHATPVVTEGVETHG